MTDLLKSIRVLDFGRYIAGPYCATMLGDLGADVIRVERREGGEDRYVTPLGEQGVGALFLQSARGKRSLTVDPMCAEGREIVERLVRTADVIVANLPAPALRAMRLDYDSLRALKPDIILTTASAFGSVGPLSGNVGFDGVAQAMSGAVYMTGEPDQPYRAQVNWVDFGTAMHCAFGTLAALMERKRSGRGQKVEGSLLGTALAFANPMLIEQGVAAPNRKPTGNRGQTAAPVDIFRTRDGWILVQVVSQPLFERWVRLMDEPHWLEDPRFCDDEARGLNAAPISERMARWCAQWTSDEAFERLGAAKIPCGPVLEPQQTLDHPQVAAMGLLTPLDFPGLPRPAPVAGMPLSMSAGEPRQPARAPMLGEHTEEILASLGYDTDAIAGLRGRGVI